MDANDITHAAEIAAVKARCGAALDAKEDFYFEARARMYRMIEAERKELFKWRRLAFWFLFLALAFVGVSIYQNHVVMQQRAIIHWLTGI